jgi:1,4-dihydroxy-2-naphthoyl-CoA synthase
MVGTTGFAEANAIGPYDGRSYEGRNAFLEKRKPNFEKNGCHNSV